MPILGINDLDFVQNDWFFGACWSDLSWLVHEVVLHDVEESLVLVKNVQIGQSRVNQRGSHTDDVIVVSRLLLLVKLLLLVIDNLLQRLQILLLQDVLLRVLFSLGHINDFVVNILVLESETLIGLVLIVDQIFLSVLDPLLVSFHLLFDVADTGEEGLVVLLDFVLRLLLEVFNEIVHLLEAILSSVVHLELLVHFFGHLEVHIHCLVVELFLQLLEILCELRVFDVKSVNFSVSLNEKIVS